MCLRNRVQLGLKPSLVLAVALTGACVLPLAAGAAPLGFAAESFAAQARSQGSSSVTPEEAILHWSGQGVGSVDNVATDATGIYQANSNHSPEGSGQGDSFSAYVDQQHGGHDDIGGGLAEQDELGGIHTGRCGSDCVSTSAVPEPARAGLMIAGAAALFLLVKRRRAGALGMIAAR